MATQKWLIGLLWMLAAGAPACAGGGDKTAKESSAGNAGVDDEKAGAEGAAASPKDGGKGSRPGADAGVDRGSDAGRLDARTATEPAQGTPASSDASLSTGDAQVAAPNGDPATPAMGPTGTLPSVTDLTQPGPFATATTAGPDGFVLFYPKELGKDGVKHPIVSWGPGAAENAGSFTTLLTHFASHGFAVISYDGTPDGQELVTAIDWLVAENGRSDSMFYQKLDTSKIAAGGHSAGSLATFKVAADKRLTTTMHLCGGTFDPHTDIANLHAPALFICGDSGGDGLISGDVARPNCDLDFMNATVPVFYGNPKGAAHMSPTEIGDAALRSKFAAACVGWLRWQLAADETRKAMFIGDACTLCKDTSWTVQQKNWK